jgi:hypothetical protein
MGWLVAALITPDESPKTQSGNLAQNRRGSPSASREFRA